MLLTRSLWRFMTGTLLAPDPPPERIAQAREQNDQMAKQAYPNSMAVSGGSAASSDSKDHPSERLKRSASSSSSSGPPSSWQHTHDEAESSLMRVNGGSASVSNKDSPYDKRAAMPQGKFKSTKTKPVHLKAAAVMPRNEFHVHDNKDDGGGRMGETMLGAQRGYKRATTDGVEHSKESRNLGGFEYGKEPVRGVNIGGWLVRESPYLIAYSASAIITYARVDDLCLIQLSLGSPLPSSRTLATTPS